MIESPLVSVIIPCYNSEKYVEQAVRSIMNQTYKNLEILITDDCSADSSFVILQRLAEEDSRIKLFKNEQNQKIVRTLNALIECANGKYIARMDADDISLPKRIEKQVAFMEENPDIAICGTNAWHIDENNIVTGQSFLAIDNDDIQIFKLYANPFYHPSVLIRSQILKNYNYNEAYLHAEDFALWKLLLETYKGYNLPDKLICYRITENIELQKKKTQCELLFKLASGRNDVLSFLKIKNLLIRGNIIYSLFSTKNISIRRLINVKYSVPLIVFIVKKVLMYVMRRGFKV